MLQQRQRRLKAVHITGSNGDWVQIDLAVEEGAEEEQTFFKGVGWVYGPLLGLTGIAQPGGGTRLFQQASLKSRLITRVPGGEDVIVRGCRGEWLYVEYNKTKGWAEPQTLCSNSLSTCG
ncbi:MAG TPA: SH3 domain-containing protein [Pyrinomonadaceae bacterium]|nr:SH3 domain-containing protein [Pyrinomonadaceae bacterium]